MPTQGSQVKKGGKNTTTSESRKKRYQFYSANHLREHAKLKRMRKSCGEPFTRSYADKHSMLGWAVSQGLIK